MDSRRVGRHNGAMTSRTRKLLALVVLLLSALPLAAYFLIDVEDFRGLIESRLERTLGREVRLGRIELSVWPVFGIRLDDVAVAALQPVTVAMIVALERIPPGTPRAIVDAAPA